jgi:predicted nuclease with RNAse H fold
LDKAPSVAGIDIGAERKGCHLVVLRDKTVIARYRKKKPEELALLCAEHKVIAVGIDAPCKWRVGENARQAERDMLKDGIRSFSTPTEADAKASTSGFYDWMFMGTHVYKALASTHALLENPKYINGKVCFETFPHAITHAFLNTKASAKLKNKQRKDLLEACGIDTSSLQSVDERDAALCALTAQLLLQGETRTFGDSIGGYIHVPAGKFTSRIQSPP